MKSKIALVLGILLGLMMLNSGLNKFFNYMELPKMAPNVGELMMALGKTGWFFPLVALVEIIGGALVAIPKTRALGAIVLLPVVVGIFLIHAVMDPASAMMSVILLLMNIGVIVESYNKYLPMVK